MLPDQNNSQAVNVTNESPNLNKTKSSKIIAIVFVVVILLAAAFYAWKSGMFAKAPYDQSNLFTGLAQKVTEIQSTSYEFSGSFVGMTREENTEVFVPIGNTKDLKEKYFRDYQRAQFVSNFVRKYVGYKPTKLNLPQNLNSLDKGFSANDPLTNKMYDYKVTESGQNFELIVEFETADAIKEAKRDYYGTPLVVEGQKVTFTKDARTLYLDSRPPQNFYEILNEGIEMVPKDINVNVSVAAKSDVSKEKDDVDFQVNFATDADLGDMTYKVDVDVLKKAKEYFVRMNNFPGMFLAFMPMPKGEWVLLDEDYTDFIDYAVEDFENMDKSEEEKLKEFMKFVLTSADKNELLKFVDAPKKDKFKDQVAYKYELQINGDGLEQFLKDVLSEVKKVDYEGADTAELENLIEYMKNEEFQHALDYYNANTKHTLWVNADGFPVKFENSNRLIPSSDRLSDRQFVLTLSVALIDINKPVDIKAPEKYKNMKEIVDSTTSLLGIDEARDKGADATIKANLANIRAEAELVYDDVGGYGIKAFPLGACIAAPGTLFSYANVSKSLSGAQVNYKDGQEITCVSQVSGGVVESWAISAPLITDPDYSYCVDSTGNAIEIIGALKGNSCGA